MSVSEKKTVYDNRYTHYMSIRKIIFLFQIDFQQVIEYRSRL